MSRRHALAAITAALAVALTAWLLWSHPAAAPVPPVANAAANSSPQDFAASVPAMNVPVAPAEAAPADDGGRITTADALNRAKGSIAEDLTILVTLFEDWRTFFPAEGNPWGDNAEITKALMGANSRHLVFVAKEHPAINAAGELCDRWGTPFRFHALSGTRMEIRSAGPDKLFGTADDAVVTPPGPAGE